MAGEYAESRADRLSHPGERRFGLVYLVEGCLGFVRFPPVRCPLAGFLHCAPRIENRRHQQGVDERPYPLGGYQ